MREHIEDVKTEQFWPPCHSSEVMVMMMMMMMMMMIGMVMMIMMMIDDDGELAHCWRPPRGSKRAQIKLIVIDVAEI